MPTKYDISDLNLPKDSEVLRLMKQCPDIQPTRFLDGEFLMSEGEKGEDIFLVLKGSFLVERGGKTSNEQPAPTLAIVSCTIDSPVFVGEMAYFGTGVRVASVKSAAAIFTLQLKSAHLDTIIAEFPVLTRCICKRFAKRLREANESVKHYHDLFKMDMKQSFIAQGEVIFSKGEQADTLYKLIDGSVRLENSTGCEIITSETVFKGFIEPSPFFNKGVRNSTAHTETQAVVLAFSNSSMTAIARNFPELLLMELDRSAC